MTIAEVSKQYELSPDTLRYYERIGLIPPVTRNGRGVRAFSEMDCRWVAFIKCMRSAGIPVEALIEYVALFQQGKGTREARKKILAKQRAIIAARAAELRETLEKLDYKIANYDSKMFGIEEKLF